VEKIPTVPLYLSARVGPRFPRFV